MSFLVAQVEYDSLCALLATAVRCFLALDSGDLINAVLLRLIRIMVSLIDDKVVHFIACC